MSVSEQLGVLIIIHYLETTNTVRRREGVLWLMWIV